MKTMMLSLLAALSVACAGPEQVSSDVISGTLRYQKIEGGVWTLAYEGKTYDLHGDLRGFKDGDEVVVKGLAQPDRFCIHMVGIVFQVETICARRK